VTSLCLTTLLAAPEEECGTDECGNNDYADNNTGSDSSSVGASLLRLFGLRGAGDLRNGSLSDDDSRTRSDTSDDSGLAWRRGCGCGACC